MSAALSIDLTTVWVLAVAGGVGSLVRYGAQKLWPASGTRIPLGVLAVNVVGSFIAGLVAGLISVNNPQLGIVLIVGFCGGLTTFSTFAVESAQLLRVRAVNTALLNIALTVVGGVVAALCGLVVATVFA